MSHLQRKDLEDRFSALQFGDAPQMTTPVISQEPETPASQDGVNTEELHRLEHRIVSMEEHLRLEEKAYRRAEVWFVALMMGGVIVMGLISQYLLPLLSH